MTLNTHIRGAQIELTTISGGHIIDATIPEVKLDVYNSPTDGYVLSWSDTENKMEWSSIGTMYVNETPTGTINGANTNFTLANTPTSGTEMIYLNGLLQEPGAGNDYTITGSGITFTEAPETNDIILASYLVQQGIGAGSSGGGMSDIVEDTTPQLGGDLDLNDHYVELKPEPSSDDSGSGMMSTMTVDTNGTGVGSALYMAGDGHFDEADASASGTMPCTAIALETGTGSKKVLHYGYMRNDGWDWTAGGLLYVSTVAGALTQTPPAGSGDQVQVVGYATHADRIFFSPDLSTAEVA